MALILTSKLAVGKYTLPLESVSIKSSWKNIGDTCEIKIPSLQRQLERNLKVGDPVCLTLGYNGNNQEEFVGFIAEIQPNIPFTLRCEDAIFLLKRMAVNNGKGHSWRSTHLKEVLKTVLEEVKEKHPSFNYHLNESIPMIELTPFTVQKGVSVAQLLQYIKETYLLAIYFRKNQLFVGMPYSERFDKPIAYSFQKNIIGNNLVFRKKEDVKLKAKAISILPNNTRIELEVGDADGEQRTLHFSNINNKVTLQQLAIAELEKYKYDGYSGNFTAFGLPFLQHSQTVSIQDIHFKQRSGRYLTDEVNTRFSVSGFRRTIELGKKV